MSSRDPFLRALLAGAAALLFILLVTSAIAGGVLQVWPGVRGYAFPGTSTPYSSTLEVDVYGEHDFYSFNSGANVAIAPKGQPMPFGFQPRGSAYVEFRFRQVGWPRPVHFEWEFAELSNVQSAPGGASPTDTAAWRAGVAESSVRSSNEYFGYVFAEHGDLFAGERSGEGGSYWNAVPNAAWWLLCAPLWLGGCLLISVIAGALTFRLCLTRRWGRRAAPPHESETDSHVESAAAALAVEDEPVDSLARPLLTSALAFIIAAFVLLSLAGTKIALSPSKEAFALTGLTLTQLGGSERDFSNNYDFRLLDTGEIVCALSDDPYYAQFGARVSNADVMYVEIGQGYPAPLSFKWSFLMRNFRSAGPSSRELTLEECRTAFLTQRVGLRSNSPIWRAIERGEVRGRASRLENLPYNAFWCLVRSPYWVAVCTLVAAIIGVKVFFDSRRRLRERLGLCLRCAYNLRATANGTPCPECGGGSAK